MCNKKKTPAESVRNRTVFKVISSGHSMVIAAHKGTHMVGIIRGEGK